MKTLFYCFFLLIVAVSYAVRAAAPNITPLGALSAQLYGPARVAMDAGGNAYVTDPQQGQVMVFDAYGRLAATHSGFARPLGIAVDAGGKIYVAEETTGSVSVFDGAWNWLYQLGAGTNEFRLPNFIAPDPTSGLVFVSDSQANQIRAYTNSGAFAFAFGVQGAASGELDFPAGLWVSPAGEIYVVDQKNTRVQVFNFSGGYLRKFKLGSSTRSQGLVGDATGHLFVVDSFQSYLRAYATNGVVLATNGGYGSDMGRFNLPASAALDSANRLLVTSANNRRVEILGVDDYMVCAARPARKTVAAGSAMEFSVALGGPGPFTYQWRKNGVDLADGGGISGVNSPTLALSGLLPADSAEYSVVVTGPSGVRGSPAAPLVVLNPPAILNSPVGGTVPQGTNVLLSVTASGDNLVYYWTHNGIPLPTAVTASLSLENVQPNDAGIYEVTVVNEAGVAASQPADLAVLIPPSILQSPVDCSVAVGGEAAFSVNAVGDALAYQWLYNDAPVLGATESSLNVTNAQLSSSGNYSVRVSNPVGETVSPAAVLNVVVPPAAPQIETVVQQPDGTIQISVQAEAGYTFTLQASADLNFWEIIHVNPSTNGLIQFVDADAMNYSTRFYRIVWQP
jgi:sugar lactone lactonase YvrE